MKRKILYILMSLTVAVALVGCTDTPVDYYSTQPGGSVSPSFSVEGGDVNVESTVREYDVPVKSNVWWKAVVEYPDGVRPGEENWCSVYPTEGLGDVTLKVMMARNIEEEGRSAVVKLIVDNMTEEGEAVQYVKVEQQASVKFIETNVPEFAMGKMRADTVVLVSANVDYKVEVDPSSAAWIELPGQTEGGKLLDKRIPLKFKTNDTGADRTGYFNVVAKDESNSNLNLRVKVTQMPALLPIELTHENSDQGLILQWTTDPSFLTYDVIVSAVGEPDNIITTINTAEDSVNLLDYDVVRNYPNYAIDVRVKGCTVEPDQDEFSTTIWSTNTIFGDGGGNGTSYDEAFVVAELRHFLNITQAGLDKFYKQTEDIDFSEWCAENTFTPMGSRNDGEHFTGGYDGQNNKIIGLKLYGECGGGVQEGQENDGRPTALWAFVDATGSIKNLTIEKGYMRLVAKNLAGFKQWTSSALIAGTNEGTISNCHLIDPLIETDHLISCGGIVGWNRGVVEDCSTSSSSTNYRIALVKESKSNSNCWVGGIVGANWKGATIKNCQNKGTLMHTITGSTVNAQPVVMGGIVGGNDGLVESCYNKADIVGSGSNALDVRLGGIAGGVILAGTSGGSVTWTNDDGSAFKGSASGNIIKCTNYGNVSSGLSAYCGGIVGDMARPQKGTLTIEECHNAGNVTVTFSNRVTRVGGIAARAAANISNSYNTGTITVNSASASTNWLFVGGICAKIFNAEMIYKNVLNAGKIDVNVTTNMNGNKRGMAVAGILAAFYSKSMAEKSQFIHSYVLEGCAGGAEREEYTTLDPSTSPNNNAFISVGQLVSMLPYKDVTPTTPHTTDFIPKDEATDQSKYVGWDFNSVWMMGAQGPELRNAAKE